MPRPVTIGLTVYWTGDEAPVEYSLPVGPFYTAASDELEHLAKMLRNNGVAVITSIYGVATLLIFDRIQSLHMKENHLV
jgi:hypothetical protein